MGVISMRFNDEEERKIYEWSGVKKRDLSKFCKTFLLQGGHKSEDDLNRITIESQIEKLREEQAKIIEILVALEERQRVFDERQIIFERGLKAFNNRQRASENFWYKVLFGAIKEYVSEEAAASFSESVELEIKKGCALDDDN